MNQAYQLPYVVDYRNINVISSVSLEVIVLLLRIAFKQTLTNLNNFCFIGYTMCETV